MQKTHLYYLYDELTGGVDIVKAQRKLENYLNDPEHKQEREAFDAADPTVLDAVRRSIKDMKDVKEDEIGRYYEDH